MNKMPDKLDQFYEMPDDRSQDTLHERRQNEMLIFRKSTFRPRFTNQERLILIAALDNYATCLMLKQAEHDTDRVLANTLWYRWKTTNDLTDAREYWKARHRFEAEANRYYEDKARVCSMLSKRLASVSEGHFSVSARETRFLLRHIPELAYK